MPTSWGERSATGATWTEVSTIAEDSTDIYIHVLFEGTGIPIFEERELAVATIHTERSVAASTWTEREF